MRRPSKHRIINFSLALNHNRRDATLFAPIAFGGDRTALEFDKTSKSFYDGRLFGQNFGTRAFYSGRQSRGLYSPDVRGKFNYHL